MATASDRVTVTAGAALAVPLGFPSGETLVPTGSVVVSRGDLSHPVVAGWIAAGMAVFDDVADAPQAEGDGGATDDKAALLDRAKALGIAADGRWGIDRLKSEIAAVEASAAAGTVADAPQAEGQQ